MARKWLLASLAALSLMQAPTVEAASNHSPFVDISGHWAEKQIDELYRYGVVNGYGAGQFRPDEAVTRAELIVMLLRAKGIQPVPAASSSFVDVPRDNWFFPYAETAYRLGFIHGEEVNGTLYCKPDDHVEKQELVTILLSAKGDSGRVNQLPWSTAIQTLNRYTDEAQVVEWNQRPLAYALRKKIVAAATDDLAPNRVITRAQAASYADRTLLQPRLAEGRKQTEHPAAFTYKRILYVETTAYHEDTKSYLGWPLRLGVVAVDPNVIPLGTHLYIEGYGYAVAADIGSAVKNNHIDVFLPSLQAAKAYGRQKDTKVYVLD